MKQNKKTKKIKFERKGEKNYHVHNESFQNKKFPPI